MRTTWPRNNRRNSLVSVVRWLSMIALLVLLISVPTQANPYLAKPAETYDNSFAEQLESSGFLRELWGNEIPGKEW